MKMKRKRALSIMMTVVLLVLTVAAAVPSASAVSADVAQTAAYAIANPAFKVEAGAQGVLVTWNADSRVDHYRVYHKTASGWTKIADNIKYGYYFDTSVSKSSSYTFTVRGLDKSNNFVTDFNRDGGTISFSPKANSYLLGDTDTDGAVTVMDSTNIQRKLAELKISNCKYIDYLGDSDSNGLTVTDATWIQRYIAQISIPYPVGGKLLNVAGTGGTEKPTEAVTVNAPSGVNVKLESKGIKEYAKVIKYGCATNLSNYSLNFDVENPKNYPESVRTAKSWVDMSIEYLDNGKVRLYFKPVTPDELTYIRTCVFWGEGSTDYKRIDLEGSTLPEGLKRGYIDFDLPLVDSTKPVVKVSWSKSSNADGYNVSVVDANGNEVGRVDKVSKNVTSTNVTLNDVGAGSYTVKVEAYKGSAVKSASKVFTFKSSFKADTEERVIKSPITAMRHTIVCNHCGMELDGTLREHILTDEEYRIMTTEEPISYDYDLWAHGWSGIHSGKIPVTAYYWENATPKEEGHGIYEGQMLALSSVFTTKNPIFELAAWGTHIGPDGNPVMGDYFIPNYVDPYTTTTLDWNFGPKGVFFTMDQMLEYVNSADYKGRWKEASVLKNLDNDFWEYHLRNQCEVNGGYHSETRHVIVGVNYLYVPATGHIEYTVG